MASPVEILEHARQGLLHRDRGLELLRGRNPAPRAETEMCRTERAPALRRRDPVGRTAGGADPRVQTERAWIAARLDQQGSKPRHRLLGILGGLQQRHPAVSEARDAPQNVLARAAADPDRQWARRAWRDGDAIQV